MDLPGFVARCEVFDDKTVFVKLPASHVQAITQSVNLVDTWMKGYTKECNVANCEALRVPTSSSLLAAIGQLDVIKPNLRYHGIEIDEWLSIKDNLLEVS